MLGYLGGTVLGRSCRVDSSWIGPAQLDDHMVLEQVSTLEQSRLPSNFRHVIDYSCKELELLCPPVS